MATETVNALLVIADIGGYTRFMNLHRTSLAHAQENTSRLLDAIIDAAPDLELSGLEGDAAFLYVTDPSASEITRSLAGLATAMHRAFHHEQAHLEQLRVCWCDGCVQTGKLTVKIVAHYGEAVLSTTRGHSTLAGVDVIVVHRMLKNSVPLDEVAMTVRATVVSRPAPTRAIIDAGSKGLAYDPGPDDCRGLILEAPESRLVNLNEEHGYVELAPGESLDVGQQVHVVPNHTCVVSNLFDEFLVERGGEIVDRWRIDARGRSA